MLLNPTLSDLVGGIESVTLSDEEARRRGTQKTVLERRSPPTFDVLIEIQERDQLALHPDVAAAVDAMVRGRPMPPEIRYRDEQGNIKTQKSPEPAAHSMFLEGGRRGMQATWKECLSSARPGLPTRQPSHWARAFPHPRPVTTACRSSPSEFIHTALPATA